jgi:hypothetical protein
MAEKKYKPSTKAVRKRYVESRKGDYWVIVSDVNPEFKAEFKVWLSERDLKTVARTLKAERLRILGLLKTGWTMDSIWMGVDDD